MKNRRFTVLVLSISTALVMSTTAHEALAGGITDDIRDKVQDQVEPLVASIVDALNQSVALYMQDENDINKVAMHACIGAVSLKEIYMRVEELRAYSNVNDDIFFEMGAEALTTLEENVGDGSGYTLLEKELYLLEEAGVSDAARDLVASDLKTLASDLERRERGDLYLKHNYRAVTSSSLEVSSYLVCALASGSENVMPPSKDASRQIVKGLVTFLIGGTVVAADAVFAAPTGGVFALSVTGGVPIAFRGLAMLF